MASHALLLAWSGIVVSVLGVMVLGNFIRGDANLFPVFLVLMGGSAGLVAERKRRRRAS